MESGAEDGWQPVGGRAAAAAAAAAAPSGRPSTDIASPTAGEARRRPMTAAPPAEKPAGGCGGATVGSEGILWTRLWLREGFHQPTRCPHFL